MDAVAEARRRARLPEKAEVELRYQPAERPSLLRKLVAQFFGGSASSGFSARALDALERFLGDMPPVEGPVFMAPTLLE